MTDLPSSIVLFKVDSVSRGQLVLSEKVDKFVLEGSLWGWLVEDEIQDVLTTTSRCSTGFTWSFYII